MTCKEIFKLSGKEFSNAVAARLKESYKDKMIELKRREKEIEAQEMEDVLKIFGAPVSSRV